MNKLARYSALAVYIGAGLTVCGTARADVSATNDPGFQAGPVKVTLGGFTEMAGIWRSRNESADVGSSFGGLPYANSNNYYTSEFRESARQSRISLLAQGPTDGVNKVEAFYAMDFLSVGVTSNSNESNSYTLRIREAYADWQNKDYGFTVTGGQTWSLATLYKHELDARKEDIPLTIDAQYVSGFNWARQAQFRFVKSFGDDFALGLSLEEPQNVIKGTAPAGADGTNSGGSGLNNGICGVTSKSSNGSVTTVTATNCANYSTDIAPDVIVKAVADPGWGHYELYSMTRFLHDRAEATVGNATTEQNNTTVAESVGGGMILPLVPKYLDFQASGLIGHGNGRYGSGQLADSTYNSGDSSVAALYEQQMLLGLVGHPSKTVDTYLYAGLERQKSSDGYGTSDNSGCDINYADSPKGGCTGTPGTIRQLTGGFWWKFYQGSLGYLTTGAQGGVVKNTTFTDVNGNVGKTNDSIVMVSFRYYPFQ